MSFFSYGQYGPRPLPGVVNPAHQIIVICFLAHARQIGGERPTLHLVAFADGVAGQTSSLFKQFFSVRGVSWLLLGQSVGES
jgi:hypothetical protein